MSTKYVVAVVRPDVVAPLQTKLLQIGVRGITLSRVKGFGETKTFPSGDGLADHTKLEVFVDESKVEALLAALRETALAGVPGAGIAAVMPVDTFEHLRASGDAAADAAT
ncbi:MAG: P-II family nitrogen regulator [Rubrivivax sp.]